MKTRRIFLLWTSCMVSMILLMPYLLESIERTFDISLLPVSKPVFLLVTFLQSSLFFAIACFGGAWFSSKTRISHLLSWDGGKMISSMLVGVSVGLAILLADYLFEQMGIRPNFICIEPITGWKGVLASFYGGIAEEVLMRYFLIALIAFLVLKIAGKNDDGFRKKVLVASVLVVSLLFGLGHLPAVQLNNLLTAPVILRVILVNAMGGIVFGLIYIRKGLFHAMAAHFTADLVLLFIFPTLYF